MNRPLHLAALVAATPILFSSISSAEVQSGRGEEIAPEENAPQVEGHPLTSVVVTQCNLIVAVYMTMPDGRLLRFDSKAQIDADALVSMAYSATHSERVEVSCNGLGSSGYETHEPT
ncbi:MAG TPA: hypothetical protein VNR40_08865 [Steroidobacter sp.]|nr:hypothetical protein [Steroidobacter sp.]